MEEYTEGWPDWLSWLIIIVVSIWSTLSFLAPYFWYRTSRNTREISEKMDDLIALGQSIAHHRSTNSTSAKVQSPDSPNKPPGAKVPIEKRNVRDGWQTG